MLVGRNDACPCGSGKKFKQCCLDRDRVLDPLERAGLEARRIQHGVEPGVVRFTREVYGAEALDRAWKAFVMRRRGIRRDAEEQLFLPWLVYDWRPLASTASRRRTEPASATPAEAFLRTEGSRLLPSERGFLEAAASAPTSFHDVVASEPGRSLRLRDALLGTEHVVFEQSGSEALRPSDILYGRVVPLGDVGLLVGSGSLVIPPIEKGVILDLRASLRSCFRRISPSALRRAEPQLRDVYFSIRNRLLHPRPQEIRNTDGDPIRFHALTYTIASAEAALDALRPLAVGQEPDEPHEVEEKDAEGRLRRAWISWLRPGHRLDRSLPNTSLGQIEIEGTTLTVHVNSDQRANAIRREIENRLGPGAVLVQDDARSLDEALRDAREGGETERDREDRRRNEEIQARPEIQRMLASMAEERWNAWLDEKIPMLRGTTPREAVKSQDGREMVEALLAQFERYEARSRSAGRPSPPYDFNRLRQRLGLPLRGPTT